ncbi:MAG: pantoate--beta-alanine ligase, partial [Edaphobacter sp.]
ASRPGHFTGVATVVAKLFHIVQPDRAYFGQKDAAQLAVLRQMARDLNFNVEIVACPIVRDADGLALSSRNKYLSKTGRTQALALRRALLGMEQMIAHGGRSSAALIQEGMRNLSTESGVRVDYLAVVDAQTLLPVKQAKPGTLIAVAAWVEDTRLIDNFVLG